MVETVPTTMMERLAAATVVQASHVVYPELQSLEAKEVATELRTGYHFQPPKHWINGTHVFSFHLSTSPCLWIIFFFNGPLLIPRRLCLHGIDLLPMTTQQPIRSQWYV